MKRATGPQGQQARILQVKDMPQARAKPKIDKDEKIFDPLPGVEVQTTAQQDPVFLPGGVEP